MNPRVSGQEWYYHAPRADEKSVKFADVQPASQIPGLGNHDNSPIDLSEDVHLRRKWFRDTDSKYVRLAKSGGRKDLFIYREHKPSKAGESTYPRVDWFDHDNPEEDSAELNNSTYASAFPEWYVHEEHRYQDKDFKPSKLNRSILGFDDMSVWKREATEKDQRCTKSSPVKLPSLMKQKNKKSHNKRDVRSKNVAEDAKGFKLPEIPTIDQIKSGQVSDIGQLLSMKYQHDWLEEQTGKQKVEEKKRNKMHEKEKEKHQKDKQVFSRFKDDETKNQDEKALFKMSRFNKVGPKTNTYRT